MTVAYVTADRELTTPTESKSPLSRYHSAISNRVDVDIVGLTGRGDRIRQLIFSGELSEANKSDVESYIGAEIVKDDQE